MYRGFATRSANSKKDKSVLKLFFGSLVAFLVGIFCRVVGLPMPAPASYVGVLLIAFLTSGYLAAPWMLSTIGR